MNVYLQPTTSSVISKTASIAKDLHISGASKILIFSEDKITLSLELELAKAFGGGFMNVDVSTFKRYVSSKNHSAKMLSKESSVMIIRKIMSDSANEDGLKIFNFNKSGTGTALVLYELISQISSAGVTVEDLELLMERDKENVSLALSNKIKGVIYVIKKYKEFTEKESVYDSSDYLGLMPQLLQEDGELKDTHVILSGFSSMTKQRTEIVEQIKRLAKGVSCVALGMQDCDAYTFETLSKLKSIDDGLIIKYGRENCVFEGEIIAKNLFNPAVYKKDFKSCETDKIFITEARNLSEETEDIARSIVSEIKNGKRYKDIAVAFGSVDVYLPYISKYFSEYEIPYYVDKAKTLDAHPICDFVTSYLKLLKRNFYKEDFINFVRSPMFDVDLYKTDELIKYVNEHAMTRKVLKRPFVYENERLLEFESMRQAVYDCFCYGENVKTISDYVKCIKLLFDRVKVFENVKKCGEKLLNYGERAQAEYNEKAGEKVLSLLDEMTVIGGDVALSISDFISVFLSGAKAVEITKIPLFKDAVYVGECKDVKIKSVKILYFAGLNGDVPFTKGDTALLTDGDLKELKGFKILVEPTIFTVNKREKESVTVAMMSFTEKLYLSYSNMGARGEVWIKSDVVSSISKIFNIKAKRPKTVKGLLSSKTLNFEDLRYLFSAKSPSLKGVALLSEPSSSGNKIASRIVDAFYSFSNGNQETFKSSRLIEEISNQKCEKRLENAQNLTFLDGYVSSTAIENYFHCPYSHYVQNNLKLQEVKDGQMKVYETGTLLHALTEKYVQNLKKVQDKLSSDCLVDQLLDEILSSEDYSYYLDNATYKYAFKELKKEGKRVCYAIYSSLKDSSFEPYLLEASFDDDHEFKAIKLKVKNGEYKIRGKVDRIDKFQDNIRIIDYKTGKIESQDEKFYVGTKLQLYLYMNAFIKDGLNPAGAYYFPVKDSFDDSADSATYKMRGTTVDDVDVFVASDNNIIENRSSKHFPVKLLKDDSADRNSHAISKQDFLKYLKYAVKVSEQGVEEITSGYITPSPYKGSCEYCKYGGMCGFSTDNGDKERQVKKIDASVIINAVDYEEKRLNCKENENE